MYSSAKIQYDNRTLNTNRESKNQGHSKNDEKRKRTKNKEIWNWIDLDTQIVSREYISIDNFGELYFDIDSEQYKPSYVQVCNNH